MKRLALALFLLAAPLLGADRYVSPTGSGTTYSIGSPGLLENILDCDGAVRLQPGDRVLARGGTYVGADAGSDGIYTLRGYCSGAPGNPITITRYQDEEAIIDCNYLGDGPCVGVAANSGTALVKVTGCTGATCTITYISGSARFVPGTGWAGWKRFYIRSTTEIPKDTPPKYLTVVSVASQTSMTATFDNIADAVETPGCAATPSTAAAQCRNASLLQRREYIRFQGLKILNTTTSTIFLSTGHATVTNSSANIVWADGGSQWGNQVNGTATVTVEANGTTVTRTGGEFFCRTGGCTGSTWPGKRILIDGVKYTVNAVTTLPVGCGPPPLTPCCTTQCPELTLTTAAPAGSGKTAILPNTEWSEYEPVASDPQERRGIWYIDTAGAKATNQTYQAIRHFYCTDATHCILDAPVSASTCSPGPSCSVEVLWPWSQGGVGEDLIRQQGYQAAMTGAEFINNYTYNEPGGVNWGGQYGLGKQVWYGNVEYYRGNIGRTRGTGHGFYLQNTIRHNENGRSYWRGNLSFRPYSQAGQIYSEDGGIGLNSFITIEDNIFLSPGHDGWPTNTWAQVGGGKMSFGSFTGGATTGCPPDYAWPEASAGGPSTKTAKGTIYSRNFYYNSGAGSPLQLGAGADGKGSCNTVVQSNLFFSEGDVQMSDQATFPTLTIGGLNAGDTTKFNLFTNNPPLTPVPDPNNNQFNGGPAPEWARSTYPNNVFLNAKPTTDMTNCGGGGVLVNGDCIFYEANEYEQGKGFAAVYNGDDDATITGLNLCAFGGFQGEIFDLFNGQCADPWDCGQLTVTGTGIAAGPAGSSGTISTCPTSATVSATFSTALIPTPGYTDRDQVSSMASPPDIGPRVVVFSLERDFAATPVATPTNTNTVTQTFTPSFTRTPTFTPTFTPSRTFTPTATWTPTNTPGASTPTSTRTFTASNTPTWTPTFTPTTAPTSTPTPTGGVVQALSIDPALCSIVFPMVLTVETGSFPGHYVSSGTANSGQIVCQFSVPNDGVYYLYARTYELDSNHDSFYFTMDDNTGSLCNTNGDTTCVSIFDTASSKNHLDTPPCTVRRVWGFESWKNWNNRSGQDGLGCSGEGARTSFPLAAGTHTFRVRQRDADTRLYYMTFDQNPDLEPQDPGALPTATAVPVPTGTPAAGSKHPHTCVSEADGKSKTGWHAHGGATSGHTHIPCPWR